MALAGPPRLKSTPETPEDNHTSVALFISKVWKIVNLLDTNHLISWSESGKTFVVHKEATFAKDVLPHYFKHNHFSSFVRQLNLYGFRKVAKPDHGGLTSITNDSVEFWHTNFRKGHPELLPLVQRRLVAKPDEKSSEVSRIMSDIHQMKEKQEGITNLLDDLRGENYYLKQEMMALKQKHDMQHKVLNKIIHFVIHMVYKGKVPRVRNSRLMLTDVIDDSLPPAKRSNSIVDSLDLFPSSPPQLYNVSSPDVPVVQNFPVVLNDEASLGHGVLKSQQHEELLSINNYNSDELLADLLNPSPPTTTLLSPPPQATLESFPFPVQTTATALVPVDTLFNAQQDIVQPYQSQSVDIVPYKKAVDSHQAELDSLPDTLLDQLNIDPSLISHLLEMDYTPSQIPEYDIVDTARLLESFLDPNHEKDICHESTVPNPKTVPALPASDLMLNTTSTAANQGTTLSNYTTSPL